MSQFKNIDNSELYYTDTNSIYIEKFYKLVDKGLGQLKLEQIFTDTTFLAPIV
jgi:hypothetical protein